MATSLTLSHLATATLTSPNTLATGNVRIGPGEYSPAITPTWAVYGSVSLVNTNAFTINLDDWTTSGTGTGTGFSGVDVWNQAISASTFKGLVIQSSADGAVTATITCAGLGTTITSLKINGEVAFVSATGLTVTGTDTLVLSATGTATVTVLYFG